MNDLQKVMLDAFKEFVRVCEKHKLQYFLIGGTALGAIRHKGFIPWDDDLDVGMPRPDYDKLMKLSKEFKSPYFLQNYLTDFGHVLPYAKIRNSNTTYIENFHRFHPINHGIWIDIFPIDGMSKKKDEVRVKGPKYRLLWFVYYFTFLAHMYNKPKKHTWFMQIPLYFVSLLFLPLLLGKWLTRLINKSMKSKKYEDSTLVGSYFTWTFNKEALPRSYYGQGIKVQFEDVQAVIPTNYDAYLKAKYGDYMQLPPVDKRYGHHHHSGLSTTVSYKDYK